MSQANFPFAASDHPIKTRPNFSLPDLERKVRHINEWDGKVIILNFWATWCPPCRKEIPEFVKLQDEYRNQGVQFIGVAIDNEQSVSQFAFEMDMNYPSLIAEIKGIGLAQQYGNRAGALPYSVIIDRHGQIVFRKTGPLSRQRIINTITSLKE
ncbi:MAG: redoxin [Cycloclasticus sp. symbiont of Poecilosclerida sp. M]|nr:MAG: redoxin [Cycloclasticus sp. symbiont of Poecilosclerida sp. M]